MRLTGLADGGFGLINLQGLPKPAFHAFRFLNWLGDEVLQRDVNHGIVTRDSTTGLVSAILFHYPPESRTSPEPAYQDRVAAERVLAIGLPVRKSIVIEGLEPGVAFRYEMLAPGMQGDVVSAWKNLGSPPTMDRHAEKLLRDYTATPNLRVLTAGGTGELVFEEDLCPWTLIALKQIPAS